MAAGTGGAVVRTVLEPGAGAAGLVRRLVQVRPGSRFAGTAGPGGELWFVIAGDGALEPGPGTVTEADPATGPGVAVGPDTGLWWPPGASYGLRADGPADLRLDSVMLPAGQPGDAGHVPRLSRLAECPAEVTGERRFRVLFGPGNGCAAATQFVGEIPPGRAPEHSHTYDEVILILDGRGVLHVANAGRPLAPGTCVHLPPGTPHCLENTGRDILRVLGVFHPGGSPAAKTAAPHG